MNTPLTINAIILEDEAVAARRLQRLLNRIPGMDIKVKDTFRSVQKLITYLETNEHPDLLLLDIMVADGSSFELFDHIEPQCPFIFITAYDEFAVKAFRKHALDYILKPIRLPHLEDALKRIENRPIHAVKDTAKEISPFKETFLIRFTNKFHSIAAKDIAFIYSSNKMAFFYSFSGQRIASDHRLQDLILQLDPEQFFRANRQFIVNRNAVQEVIIHSRSRLKLILSPNAPETIVISTELTPVFKKWFGKS
ncbi:MAG: response regulator transcription factor [Flavobacteriales bacterium]|nr:response regulator transcription factor [Flavobacteriales bacterium]